MRASPGDTGLPDDQRGAMEVQEEQTRAVAGSLRRKKISPRASPCYPVKLAMSDGPVRLWFRPPSGGSLHDQRRRGAPRPTAWSSSTTDSLPSSARSKPGPRLHLCQGADGLPRTQEHRADRPECRQRQCLRMQKFINIAPWDHDDVQAEVQPSSPRNWSPPPRTARSASWALSTRAALPRRAAECRRRTPTQRSPGQGRQLPGRGLPGRRHPRRRGPLDHRALLARDLVRGHRGVPRPPRKAHIPETGRLPNQARRSPRG